MAEEEIIETEEAAPASETATVEPHGSASAPRPGDRKYGNHKGRPSERRGGRGGLRRNLDNYSERVVAINRIAKTTKGGKNVRFSALAVVGDDKGKYGFALSKSSEVPDAIKKALAKARKQMRTVEVINGTIAHDVEGKFGATKVVLKPAPEGTGIVAGGAVRAIVELAGIKNLVANEFCSVGGKNDRDLSLVAEVVVNRGVFFLFGVSRQKVGDVLLVVQTQSRKHT